MIWETLTNRFVVSTLTHTDALIKGKNIEKIVLNLPNVCIRSLRRFFQTSQCFQRVFKRTKGQK
ncbi:hypothetical protein KHO74_00062 [Bacteroides thetaiotaomicron]|nr:hypothetical protein KHO73_00067 [Bacteroides thetaiotaomicron]QZU84112.1 hypothetical protein KHO74_00062 [Bacteroides thetaiotaomicron]TSE41733.1 hypothetical protein EH213_04722 [Bacteroides thetaiotaomicron]